MFKAWHKSIIVGVDIHIACLSVSDERLNLKNSQKATIRNTKLTKLDKTWHTYIIMVAYTEV